MICTNCKKESANIVIQPNGHERCHNCGGFGESSGASTHNILTRNSDRLRAQQLTHEADQLTPFVFDKALKKPVPNQEFAKVYPEKAGNYFDESQMREVGLENYQPPASNDAELGNIEYTGKEEDGISEVINGK